MVLQGIKKASSISAGQLFAKKLIPVRSSPPLIKKSTLTQSSLLQALPSCRRDALVRDLLEEKMDGGQDNNNNENKATNDNSLLEKFNKDDDVQFTLFGLQVVLANSWFLGGFLYAHKTKVLNAHIIPSPHNHVQSGSHLCNYHTNKREEKLKTKNFRYTRHKKGSY